MKLIFAFSHPSLDYTYRDFPGHEVAEKHREEVAEDLDLPAHELVIEENEVSADEFDELIERAGLY